MVQVLAPRYSLRKPSNICIISLIRSSRRGSSNKLKISIPAVIEVEVTADEAEMVLTWARTKPRAAQGPENPPATNESRQAVPGTSVHVANVR